MLYDKKWDQKPDLEEALKLESLIRWLEVQPQDKKYDYCCICGCLLWQYFSSMGFKGVEMGIRKFCHDGGEVLLPSDFNSISLGNNEIAEGASYKKSPFRTKARTFGAALSRARQVSLG
jgi:hypothetical protein